MRKCPNCGKKNPDSALICSNCGSALPEGGGMATVEANTERPLVKVATSRMSAIFGNVLLLFYAAVLFFMGSREGSFILLAIASFSIILSLFVRREFLFFQEGFAVRRIGRPARYSYADVTRVYRLRRGFFISVNGKDMFVPRDPMFDNEKLSEWVEKKISAKKDET